MNRARTGFAKELKINAPLAQFLNIETGSMMTTPTLSSLAWAEFRKRDLIYNNDKRILRVDKQISELFGIPMSVNDITDHRDPNGLSLFNFQRYLKNAINKQ